MNVLQELGGGGALLPIPFKQVVLPGPPDDLEREKGSGSGSQPTFGLGRQVDCGGAAVGPALRSASHHEAVPRPPPPGAELFRRGLSDAEETVGPTSHRLPRTRPRAPAVCPP